MTSSEVNNSEGNYTEPLGYVDPKVMELRLGTDPFLKKFELYLKGSELITVYDDEGRPGLGTRKIGTPLLNDVGIQSVMRVISNLANPQVVQGNLTEESYGFYLAEVRQSLARNMMNNKQKYGLEGKTYTEIIDNIMLFIIPYISRLIGGLDRDSISKTFKSQEVINTQSKRGISIPFVGK